MEPVSASHDNNLETFYQIWLCDPVNNSQKFRDAQQQVRSSINYIKTFEHVTECEQYIRSLSDVDRIVFIVDDHLGQQIIPRICQYRQVLAIYVYGTEKQTNETSFKQFMKFRGMRTKLNELANLIQLDCKKRSRYECDESLSINIFSSNIDQEVSTVELSGQFIHSQLLIDCLLRMKSTETEIEDFVNFCKSRKEYQGNEEHLRRVQQFQNEYSSEKSLLWYTKNSFVYRMLNKALRIQNVDVLFLFRFLIRDLAQQLKKHQCSSSESVYRGQSMGKTEIDKLHESIGKMISINSFLSTTRDREVAKMFADKSIDLEAVLFEININSLLDGIKPFADVSSFSDFPQEKEILFMLGSIFRIDNVYQDENGMWIIQLNLCSDHDRDLKPIFNHLLDESGNCESILLAFGNILQDMGKFDEAKTYYDHCLKQLPSDDHPWSAYCYYLLGLIATEKGNNDVALDLLNKSLKIRKRLLPLSDPSIADTLTGIARVYYNQNQCKQALDLYTEALLIFQQAFGKDHLTSAMGYTNMGVVTTAMKKYSEALDYHKKALAIRKKHLPPDHFRFGTSLKG
ncbi:unnamed protein product [Rotaria sp. Silwood1]|nr:unnamed protein product [Rotaria sp. Silwood1]CAF4874601.1 unnamed protein product [Rotaria sp. Silwood1]